MAENKEILPVRDVLLDAMDHILNPDYTNYDIETIKNFAKQLENLGKTPCKYYLEFTLEGSRTKDVYLHQVMVLK